MHGSFAISGVTFRERLFEDTFDFQCPCSNLEENRACQRSLLHFFFQTTQLEHEQLNPRGYKPQTCILSGTVGGAVRDSRTTAGAVQQRR